MAVSKGLLLLTSSVISVIAASEEICNGNGTLWRLSDSQKSIGRNNPVLIFRTVFRFFSPPTRIEPEVTAYNALLTRLAYHDAFTFWETDTKQFITGERPSNPASYTLDGPALEEAAQNTWELFFYIATKTDLFNVRDGPAGRIAALEAQGAARETPIEEGVQYGDYPADVSDCIEDNSGDDAATQSCIDDLLEQNCWSPLYVASELAWRYTRLAENDGLGWNNRGKKSFDGSECTANCRFFSDVVNYQPQNRYDSLRGQSKFRIKGNGEFKLNLNKKERRWAPLLESDINGFFFESQFALPHIGFTGRTFGITESDRDSGDKCKEGSFKPAGLPKACAKINDPKYDYGAEAMQLIERMNSIVDNDYLMAEVDLMQSRGNILSALAPERFSSFRNTIFWYGLEAIVNYDAFVVSQREKVIFDLIRPTTVIQALDDEEIEVAVWDSGERGEIRSIKARDFQPYSQVSPDSEFPSSLACLCRATADVTRAWLEGLTSVTDLDVNRNIGARKGRHNGASLSYPTLQAWNDACAQSRLNAGVAFTASVQAANELCSGIGQATYDRWKFLLNL